MFTSQSIAMYGQTKISMRSDGVLALQSKTGSWNGGGSLNFKAAVINLNGGATQPATTVSTMAGYKLADTKFVTNQGWVSEPGTLSTIVTRAPTHEPFAGHNSGVDSTTNLNDLSANATAGVASTSNVTITPTTRQAQAQAAFARVSTRAVQNPISADNYVKEPASTQTVPAGQTGQ
jgi:hypothetical protein